MSIAKCFECEDEVVHLEVPQVQMHTISIEDGETELVSFLGSCEDDSIHEEMTVLCSECYTTWTLGEFIEKLNARAKGE
jgi:hypothetical protein